MDDSFPIEPFEKLGYSVEVYGQKSYNGVAIISKIRLENVKKVFHFIKFQNSLTPNFFATLILHNLVEIC